MCLGIPMRIVDLKDDDMAQAETFGVRRTISTALLTEPPRLGEWVMVHVGYALEKLEYEEAVEILALLETVGTEEGKWTQTIR